MVSQTEEKKKIGYSNNIPLQISISCTFFIYFFTVKEHQEHQVTTTFCFFPLKSCYRFGKANFFIYLYQQKSSDLRDFASDTIAADSWNKDELI